MTAARAAADREPDRAEALRQRLLDLVGQQRLSVPLLPQVAREVLPLTSDDETSAEMLSALVHKDPALAARVVRLANSAAYAPRTPITSVQHAIARIGLAALRETLLAASVASGVFRVPGFEQELYSLWRHSLASAGHGKRIAAARALDPDHFYLCGLLHAVGAPVMLQAALDQAGAVGMTAKGARARVQIYTIAAELAPLAGATVATAWKLPAALVACARHYEDPMAASDHRLDCCVVFVARQLAACALAPDEAVDVATPEHPAYVVAGIDAGLFERLRAHAEAVRAEVDALTA